MQLPAACVADHASSTDFFVPADVFANQALITPVSAPLPLPLSLPTLPS